MTTHRAFIRKIATAATTAVLIMGAAGVATATGTRTASTPSGTGAGHTTPATAWLVASGK